MDSLFWLWAIAVWAGDRPVAALSQPWVPPLICQTVGCLPPQQQLHVPDMGQFQDTAVDCGPHAAARVLAGLGLGDGDNLYQRLKQARMAGLGQDPLATQLGTTPDFLARLVSTVTDGRAIAHVERQGGFAALKQRLQAGNPVLALVRQGTVPMAWGSGLAVPGLHWIVVTGFDEPTQRVWFRDTNSNAVGAIAYADFLNRAVEARDYTWTWELRDRTVATVLQQTGTTPQTFLWIEVRP
jgi:hypothetical protein